MVCHRALGSLKSQANLPSGQLLLDEKLASYSRRLSLSPSVERWPLPLVYDNRLRKLRLHFLQKRI
jgi:hypothetical protein